MVAYFYLLISGCPSVQCQQTSVVDSWKRRKITLSFQDYSLSAASRELANKIGKSILIEGEPERTSFDLNKTDSVETLLNEVADAFDYSWHLSKSGVLLFTKRFHNRAEYPQIVELELSESVTDMLDIMRSLPASSALSISIQDQIVSLAHSLIPIQIETLKQGGKLRLGSLSEDQRKIAESLIYTKMFQNIRQNWKSLDEQLAGIKETYLRIKSSSYTNTVLQKQENLLNLILQYVHPTNRQEGIFQCEVTKENLNVKDVGADDTSAVHKASSKSMSSSKEVGTANLLSGVTTLDHVVQILAQETGSPLLVSPALSSRRLIVQLQKATAKQTINALAELEGWTWRSTKEGTLLLTRSRSPSCANLEEVRQAMGVVLPADMRRFLTERPALVENEIIYPVGLSTYAGHENAMRVRAKLEELLAKRSFKFYMSVRSQLQKQDTLPFKQLTFEQRSELSLILTLKVCVSSVLNFTSLFDRPTTYESNPAEAYLLLSRSKNSPNFADLLIQGDISSTQRGGAFGAPLMLDTMTAPIYKTQKSPIPEIK